MIEYYAVLHRAKTQREWETVFTKSKARAMDAITRAIGMGYETLGPFKFNYPLGNDRLRDLLNVVANTIEAYDVLKDHTDWFINWEEGGGEIKEHYDNAETGDSDVH